jgi:hypothetical protein
MAGEGAIDSGPFYLEKVNRERWEGERERERERVRGGILTQLVRKTSGCN